MLTNLHLLHLRVVRCSRASPYLPSPASFCLTLLSSFALGFLERCCLGLFEPSVMMVGSKAQAGAEPHSGEEWPWLTTVLSASHSCRSPRTHSYAACSSDVTCSRHAGGRVVHLGGRGDQLPDWVVLSKTHALEEQV
ncbi:uncharacterized protein LOC127007316 isoform X2 [Eriocheir sinensis]|uniref:uncharacterized protein LOC127007316 isoform X2 n=1 Tax=Eriocheir sinensis TaxID=95602 RepID=UPI0021C844D2|nr:uncharacterized protein LOC127007316 isoform X2 [Eriocheir sinensis]